MLLGFDLRPCPNRKSQQGDALPPPLPPPPPQIRLMASTWSPHAGSSKRRFLDWGARWLWRGEDRQQEAQTDELPEATVTTHGP